MICLDDRHFPDCRSGQRAESTRPTAIPKAGNRCNRDPQIHLWLGEGSVVGHCGAGCAILTACGRKTGAGSNNLVAII
jgi:hypothetical protein